MLADVLVVVEMVLVVLLVVSVVMVGHVAVGCGCGHRR